MIHIHSTTHTTSIVQITTGPFPFLCSLPMRDRTVCQRDAKIELGSKTHDGVGILVPELLVGGFLVFSCKGPWWGRGCLVSTSGTCKWESIYLEIGRRQ